ncbi:MAG: hypothetical protein KAS84_01340 [Anaerolineales bacterium]|nr:hypothetical protein [Anaerolineales bacterium]
MVKQLQLIFRLMRDKRVHPFIKVLPFLSLIYLIYPDFIPGPFDDAVVITLFLQFFLILVPDDLIEEHKFDQEIEEHKTTDEDNIIEGEFWEE